MNRLREQKREQVTSLEIKNTRKYSNTHIEKTNQDTAMNAMRQQLAEANARLLSMNAYREASNVIIDLIGLDRC